MPRYRGRRRDPYDMWADWQDAIFLWAVIFGGVGLIVGIAKLIAWLAS